MIDELYFLCLYIKTQQSNDWMSDLFWNVRIIRRSVW